MYVYIHIYNMFAILGWGLFEGTRESWRGKENDSE
jgi:hypothetical protein